MGKIRKAYERRSSDINTFSTRTKQTARNRRKWFWAAGYPSQVRWEGFLSCRPGILEQFTITHHRDNKHWDFKISYKTHLFKWVYSLWLCNAPLVTVWWSVAECRQRNRNMPPTYLLTIRIDPHWQCVCQHQRAVLESTCLNHLLPLLNVGLYS